MFLFHFYNVHWSRNVELASKSFENWAWGWRPHHVKVSLSRNLKEMKAYSFLDKDKESIKVNEW
jgi:hypothetical protein